MPKEKQKPRRLRDAGYTEATALKRSYQFLRRPLMQSALAEALDRLGVTFEKIVQPVADGLEATIVLKNTQELVAKKTTIPDLPTRLQAHDRAVALLAGRPRHGEMPEPPPRGLTVIFKSVPSGNDAKPKVIEASTEEDLSTKQKPVRVEFRSIPAGRPTE